MPNLDPYSIFCSNHTSIYKLFLDSNGPLDRSSLFCIQQSSCLVSFRWMVEIDVEVLKEKY